MVPRDHIQSRQKNHSLIARKHVMPLVNQGFQISSTTDLKEAKAVVCEADPVVLVNKTIKKMKQQILKFRDKPGRVKFSEGVLWTGRQ